MCDLQPTPLPAIPTLFQPNTENPSTFPIRTWPNHNRLSVVAQQQPLPSLSKAQRHLIPRSRSPCLKPASWIQIHGGVVVCSRLVPMQYVVQRDPCIMSCHAMSCQAMCCISYDGSCLFPARQKASPCLCHFQPTFFV